MKWLLFIFIMGCSSMDYNKTVEYVDLDKYMGDWYVLASRPTMFESDVNNGVENYNLVGDRIDVTFTFNTSEGKKKVMTQKGKVIDKKSNAHWKVQPLWPFWFDFLVVDLADDYSWTAVGVPSGKYLWIMSKSKQHTREEIDKMLESVQKRGYPINDIRYVPHD